MNNTLPFVDEKDLEDSILYKPVKSIAPMIFPSILNDKEEDEATASKAEA